MVKRLDKGQEFENSTVQEFLGKPPSWMVRWGISVLFGVLVVLFVFSYFVELDDEIQIPLRTAEDRNSQIGADQDWYIKEVHVQSGMDIEKGEPLLMVTKSATLEHIQRLQQEFSDEQSGLNTISLTIDSIIFAPISGKVLFHEELKSDMYISSGTKLVDLIGQEHILEAIIPNQYANGLSQIDSYLTIGENGKKARIKVHKVIQDHDQARIQLVSSSDYFQNVIVLNVNRMSLFDKLFKRRRIK